MTKMSSTRKARQIRVFLRLILILICKNHYRCVAFQQIGVLEISKHLYRVQNTALIRREDAMTRITKRLNNENNSNNNIAVNTVETNINKATPVFESENEQLVYDFINELHTSQYIFRIVLIGNGSILETTSLLGPVFKVNISPKTNEPLITFASADKSFEFHIKIKQVSSISLLEKVTTTPSSSSSTTTTIDATKTTTTMQIIRFLSIETTPLVDSFKVSDKNYNSNNNDNNIINPTTTEKPMFSLILTNKTNTAQEWFRQLKLKHNDGIIKLL